MLKLIFVLLTVTATVLADDGVNWVLLIAGSNEYYNYRHQSDICHAYQIVHKNGIPDERIVVMMYDDIANNPENKIKGKIFNRPGGPDVYNGTVKDYTKKTVTPSTFLKVLQGQNVDVGSQKVIKSGPNDNVFVYFADHGAPGLIAFPDGSALHASDLNKAIKSMNTNKKYKNLVFYIEACESGSMFDGLLPENINVYATTAANTEESSYACYYDEKLDTYLGDLYSVNWMEDSDREDLSTETLHKQFTIVKKLTNESHVMEYGNLTMGQTFFLSQFQAEQTYTYRPHIGLPSLVSKKDNARTEDVRMKILQRKLLKESDMEKRREILSEMEKIYQDTQTIITVFENIVQTALIGQNLDVNEILNTKSRLTKHESYKTIVDFIIDRCFSLKNEQVLRHLYKMVNLCERGVELDIVLKAIDKVCDKKFFD